MNVRLGTSFLKCSLQCSCFKFNAGGNSIRSLNMFPIASRWYSQENTKKVEKMTVIPTKTTKSRRKSFQLGSVEKSGFWNVVAVTTAEEYELESLFKALKCHKSYSISNVFDTDYSKGLNFDFLHAIVNQKVDDEKREVFFFRQGSFVVWNVTDAEIENISSFVKNFEINTYNEMIVRNEMEVMPYTYSVNNNRNSVVHKGNICLSQVADKNSLDKYTCSNGMICSVKLGVWETLLDEFIESVEPLTFDLKQGNRIRITRKELLKKTGELYALKHKINLSSDLLDVPDFYWEREELEGLFLSTCRYFNIPKRTRVINDKIHHCIELVELLSGHLSDKHHIRLEWMIIVLIMVEIAFESFLNCLFTKYKNMSAMSTYSSENAKYLSPSQRKCCFYYESNDSDSVCYQILSFLYEI